MYSKLELKIVGDDFEVYYWRYAAFYSLGVDKPKWSSPERRVQDLIKQVLDFDCQSPHLHLHRKELDWLVNSSPALDVNTVVMPSTGQSLLHYAILNQKIKLVKFLVERAGAVVDTEALEICGDGNGAKLTLLYLEMVLGIMPHPLSMDYLMKEVRLIKGRQHV
jgi:hypothetical protein